MILECYFYILYNCFTILYIYFIILECRFFILEYHFFILNTNSTLTDFKYIVRQAGLAEL
jgi:hypothetical protein